MAWLSDNGLNLKELYVEGFKFKYLVPWDLPTKHHPQSWEYLQTLIQKDDKKVQFESNNVLII